MIIDIPFPIRVRIEASAIPSLHASLVAIRDSASGNVDQLNAIIEALANKLQFLEDRKLLIQQAKEEEEERVRLIRFGSGTS